MKASRILLSLIAVVALGAVASVLLRVGPSNRGRQAAALEVPGIDVISADATPGDAAPGEPGATRDEGPATEPAKPAPDTGTMFLGKFVGKVTYDSEKD